MISLHLSLTVFLMSCCSCVNTQFIACASGWFGSKCQFQCHCTSTDCHLLTGQCPANYTCSNGWFGTACQYRDLSKVSNSTIFLIPSQPIDSWVTDTNDSTCNKDVNLKTVYVTWSSSVSFTWMRITLKDVVIPQSLTVSFTTRTSSNATCIDKKIYLINNTTLDIQCKGMVDTTSIVMEGQGIKSLCSLFINGGRNVALKQHAMQTPTSSCPSTSPNTTAEAAKAVDGNTSALSNTCMCTRQSYTYPSWNVTFDLSHVLTSILLYNHLEKSCTSDTCRLRLNTFGLETFNSSGTVFRYRDNTSTSMSLFEVTVTEMENTIPVNGLRITLNKNNLDLAMCEVEAYGECVPGSWGLECNKICGDRCASQCHVETGSCPVCIDFDNPPNCHTGCPTGYFGYDCSQKCPQTCKDLECDSIKGQCFLCIDGYRGTSCEQALSKELEEEMKSLTTGFGVGLGVSSAVLISLVCVIYYLVRRRRQALKHPRALPGNTQIESITPGASGTVDSQGYTTYVIRVKAGHYSGLMIPNTTINGAGDVSQPPHTYINDTSRTYSQIADC